MTLQQIKALKELAWRCYLLSIEESDSIDRFLNAYPNTSDWQGSEKCEIIALRLSHLTVFEIEIFDLFVEAFRQGDNLEKQNNSQSFSFGIRETKTFEFVAKQM